MKQAGAGKVSWGEHCVHSPSPLASPGEHWDGSSAGEAAPRALLSLVSTVAAQSRSSSALSSRGCASVEQQPLRSRRAESRGWVLGSRAAPREGGHSLTQVGTRHSVLTSHNRCRCGSGKLSGLAFQSRRLPRGQLGGFLSLLPACPAAAGLSCLHRDRQLAARGMEGSWNWNCFTFPHWAVTGASTGATGAAGLSSKQKSREDNMGDTNPYGCSTVSVALRSFHLCTVHSGEI